MYHQIAIQTSEKEVMQHFCVGESIGKNVFFVSHKCKIGITYRALLYTFTKNVGLKGEMALQMLPVPAILGLKLTGIAFTA